MSAPSDPDFQSNQKLFYILAKFSPVGIFQTNLDGNCIYVNHRWCEITGLAPEQAYEQGWIVALHPEDRARVHDDWYRAAKANTRFQSKYRFQKPDGTITWVLGQAVRHEGADLDSPGYIGTITDITEVTKSEHDLGAAKEQYQLLFERNPLPGWVFDIETLAFVEVNQAAVNHYGYSRQEFLQMTLKDIRLPAELPRLENSLKVMPPGLKRAGVWTHRKKDGKLIEAEVFNYGVMFGGKPARLVLVNDVTERKHYEEGLKEIGRLAALKQTAAVFAHEVANPLNGISAILHLLREQSMQDAQGRGLLQDAINEINRLGSLLNDFRTYARPEDIQREIVDLRVLVRETLSTEMPDYRQRKIISRQEFAPEFPLLRADRSKLKQVFLNLFKNAVEAMPDGGTLKIAGRYDTRQAWIEISDTGIGVSQNIDIFDAFATTKPHGTGLGLSIVKKIVAAHGGTVTYTSAPDQGTVFRLTFPLNETAAG